jgi:hypothetical protein
MPREPLHAPDDLRKWALSQLAFGQLQDEVRVKRLLKAELGGQGAVVNLRVETIEDVLQYVDILDQSQRTLCWGWT